MSTRTVTTQAELDAALAKRVSTIIIDSPRGVVVDRDKVKARSVRVVREVTIDGEPVTA